MQPFVSRLAEPSFWELALQVAGVNFLLSGDNVVAITLASRELPARQRRWGIALGVGVSVIVTAFFIAIVSFLMQTPFLRIAAGVALLHIACNLGSIDPDDDPSASDATAGVFRAARAVAVATLVMSLDNVVAIAAVARDDLVAMTSGLVVSIPLVVAGAATLVAALDRFPSLALAGAGFLGWIAGETIAADPAIAHLLDERLGSAAAPEFRFAIALAGAASVIVVKWRSTFRDR
ncbi:YjbE family putative metal transport protein [Methylosinus sp. Sm6]|uniref:YjbE family putative metal transport protein n=1 Tax=Methylosinus sp. Sm6 TaxID=2866948 RepID=UPI001C99C5F7|nr:YjbE family putative metal transport protein [Methylosinus sp. Sm6]MBY6241630.1 YjbE family putative metal transport protein [Methylosinus sp. Sm6]